jgi:phage minor structural protein GP20|nr:MAG TPA: minor structural protein [Caudoviricetes sp.]DAW47314.1 MAG TPA: minor structural protein [Caudoviricetes sp.]
MKKEELQKLGLTEEQINEVFKMNGLDVNGAKGELENAKKELEDYKAQFTSTQAELKKLQELKPEELSKQVSDLNEKLASQKADFEKQIADRNFNDLLAKTVTTAGGREAKAIMPFLDIEALKASKNQEADIKTAIETVKSEHDYLFTSTEPVKNAVSSTASNANASNTALDFAKSVMGIKEK